MRMARPNKKEDAPPPGTPRAASRGVALQRNVYASLPGFAKAPTTGAFCMLVM